MVATIPNPALDAFVARISPEIIFAEVLVRKVAEGFDLRHAADRDVSTTELTSADQLRQIAQFTGDTQFRPLKTAPTLQRGWRFAARTTSELDGALQCLYPNGIVDWFAAQNPSPPVTHYRDFAARQSGMYRVTDLLSDEQVAHIARAGCHERFCLKQRLWTVKGLSPERTSAKSLIPCLEPCAVLLEFARSAARIEQRVTHNVLLTLDELATATIALDLLAETARTDGRVADFSAPNNGMRAQWVFEKLKTFLSQDDEHEGK